MFYSKLIETKFMREHSIYKCIAYSYGFNKIAININESVVLQNGTTQPINARSLSDDKGQQ